MLTIENEVLKCRFVPELQAEEKSEQEEEKVKFAQNESLMGLKLINNEVDYKMDKKSKEPKFAYQEVVRTKQERAKLPGHTCRDCDECISNIDTTGFSQDKKDLIQKYSRHRHREESEIPPTPAHYWAIPSLSTPTKESQS
eukprot:maker-scaffold_15-snap-gene-2.31-mRNA-1 protein AED:0.01 eAED:0.01 QI:97/0/1/1/0/0.5/2/1073/140